jgi:hypothetical protein
VASAIQVTVPDKLLGCCPGAVQLTNVAMTTWLELLVCRWGWRGDDHGTAQTA